MSNTDAKKVKDAFIAGGLILIVGVGLVLCSNQGVLMWFLLLAHASMSAEKQASQKRANNPRFIAFCAAYMLLMGLVTAPILLIAPDPVINFLLGAGVIGILPRMFINWVLAPNQEEQGSVTHLRGRSQVDSVSQQGTDLIALRRQQREALLRGSEPQEVHCKEQ